MHLGGGFSLTNVRNIFESSTDALLSLMKVNRNLKSRLSNDEIIVDICWRFLFKGYRHCCCYNTELCKNNFLFDVMDRFLYAFVENDAKMLRTWKKELFISNKLYLSLLLDFVLEYTLLKDWRFKYSDNWKTMSEVWIRMSDGFLGWICSTDERLKMKLEKELWSSKEIINANKQFKINQRKEEMGEF